MNPRVKLLCALGLLAFTPTGYAADTLPTEQDLQQLFEQKQYRTCLQLTARVLNLGGDAAKKYDPFVLQMRRGECLLNLNDPATAMMAYEAALKTANSPQQANDARAMVVLIRASRAGFYTPQKPPSTPINIVPWDSRKNAVRAAFIDGFADSQQDIQNALQATSLVPIMNFVPKAQDLHALEMTGFGTDEQTKPMLMAIGERARNMITAELDGLSNRVNVIQQRAGQMVASGQTITQVGSTAWFVNDTRVGLSPDDRTTLREMLPYITDIVNAATRGKQIAQTFGADGLAWDPIIADANRVGRAAQNVLDTE